MAMIGLVSFCLVLLQAEHLRGPGPEIAKALDRAACQVSEQIQGLRNFALGFLDMKARVSFASVLTLAFVVGQTARPPAN